MHTAEHFNSIKLEIIALVFRSGRQRQLSGQNPLLSSPNSANSGLIFARTHEGMSDGFENWLLSLFSDK